MEATDFTNISIKGRVAFSICCLKSAIHKFGCENSKWSLLLKELFSYTNIQYLDDWLEKIAEYIPDVIMDYEVYVEKDFEFVSKSQFDELKKLYSSTDNKVRRIIDLIFYMGTMELYGMLVKKGYQSLGYLQKVIDIMKDANIPLPSMEPFKKYGFDKHSGWGESFNAEEINCLY